MKQINVEVTEGTVKRNELPGHHAAISVTATSAHYNTVDASVKARAKTNTLITETFKEFMNNTCVSSQLQMMKQREQYDMST